MAATEALVQRVGAIARRFLIQFWVPFTVGLVLLVGIVVALIFVQGGSGGGLGALGAIAAAGGITWKGVESSLGTAIKNTEPALWGAELDLVIAVGITRLPGEAQASLSVPRDKTKSPSVGLKQ